MLEDHALDASVHDRKGFDCGVQVLNAYRQLCADQDRRRGVTSAYVLTDAAAPAVILGCFRLAAAEVDSAALADAGRKRLPRFPVPCFRLGRLAASQARHGQGIGRLLVGCAVDRCLAARQPVAAYALLVDAKDKAAEGFYRHFGFTSLRDTPRVLYLPLGR